MALTKIRGSRQIMDGTILDAQINASAAIALTKLANGAKILLDDSVTLQANMDANSKKIINLADGSADNDACTYGQLSAVAVAGKAWKEVILYIDQLVDGASGGIYAGNVITLNANLQADDTITLNDGSSSESYVADTDFDVGVDIDATLANLSTVVNAGAIAVSSVVSTLSTIDGSNNVMIIYQDTIGEATRIYGDAAAASRVEILPTTLTNLYEGIASDLVAMPSSDPAATNFGFSRVKATLVVNETHYCRECDGSISWDGDAEVWNLTGASSIPYASTSIHGKVKVSDGVAVTGGIISVDLTANEGLKLTGASPDKTMSIDYDNTTIGIVSNQLAVKTDGIDDTHIDWGTGAGQVSQDDVVDGGTYKQYNPASVDINGGAIDAVTLGASSAITEATIDNIKIDGNTIISTDSNGNIALTPNGTGEVDISKVDIDSGTIDGVTIATSDVTVGGGKTLDVSAGTLTLANDQISGDKVEGGTINAVTINTLTSTSVLGTTFDTNVAAAGVTLAGTTLAADGSDVNINIALTPKGTGEVDISKVDIDSGTIDGVTIATSDVTVGGGKTLDVSAGTLTLANDQISGDEVEGGTINSITINTLAAGTADIDGGSVDAVTLGTNSAITQAQIDNININGNAITSTDENGNITLTPNGTGEVDISKVDVDSGTIDGVTIGTNSVCTDLRVDNLQVDGNTITATDTNGGITLTPDGTGSVTLGGKIVASGAVKDEDTMVSDSDVHLATQQSIKAYVDGKAAVAFKTISVSGQNDVVADASTDILTLVAGTDISITTNETTDTITVNCTDGASSLTASLGVERSTNNFQLDLLATGALGLTGNEAKVNVDGSSIEIATNALQVKALGISNAMLAGSIADSKLSTITTADKVSGSAVQLAATTAIEDSTGLKIKDALAGNGLTISSQIMAVGAGNGISVAADAVAVDLDGSTLSVGGSGLKLADLASGWVLRGSGSNIATAARHVTREVTNESADGSRTAFTVDYTPVAATEMIFLNGILQNEGAGNDYTISGSTITFGTAPETNDELLVSYFASN